MFEPKQLMELANAQCLAFPYDGLNPLPPTLCYLKPHYRDVNKSYFDQLGMATTMTSNFDLILPYVKSLAPLLADEEISEIMVNASGAVFIEREGRLSAIDGVRDCRAPAAGCRTQHCSLAGGRYRRAAALARCPSSGRLTRGGGHAPG